MVPSGAILRAGCVAASPGAARVQAFRPAASCLCFEAGPAFELLRHFAFQVLGQFAVGFELVGALLVIIGRAHARGQLLLALFQRFDFRRQLRQLSRFLVAEFHRCRYTSRGFVFLLATSRRPEPVAPSRCASQSL